MHAAIPRCEKRVPRVLLITASTTRSVTDLIEHHARKAIDKHVEIRAVTAAFGAPYVSTEAAYAVARHAALDCLQRHAKGCDAVLLACFGDPGLFALREQSELPVLGMAEACMAEAANRDRFSIICGRPGEDAVVQLTAVQADPGAIRQVGVARAARRSGHVARHRAAGEQRDRARHLQHLCPRLLRLLDRLHAWPGARHRRRLLPWNLDRQDRDRDRGHPRLGAALLARRGAAVPC